MICIRHRLKLFQNRMLRRIFGPKRDEVTRKWRKLHYTLMICTAHPISLGDKTKKNEKDGVCSAYGGQERCIQDFGGKPEGKRDHLEDPGVDGRIILIWIFRKWDVGTWTGSIWLRIRTGDGHL